MPPRRPGPDEVPALLDHGTLDDADEEALRQEICRSFAVPPHVIGLRPWPAHLRFRFVRHVDHAAIWLAEHGHDRAAIWLWRAFRLW